MKNNTEPRASLRLVLLNIFLITLLIISFLMTGCQTAATETTSQTVLEGYDASDYDTDYSDENPQTVTLNNDSIDFSGEGATVEGTTLTITQGGAYILTGTLDDGSIVVQTDENSTVRLVLKDAHITSSQGAAIYSAQAGKTLITLEAGTVNSLADGSARASAEDPTAALYVQDDLTLGGEGALEVTGNYNDAITAKDDLKIMSGDITATAVDDGIVGRDALLIAGGTLNINAAGDGLKATNDTDTAKGYVQLDGGSFAITAGTDGIQAETSLTVNGGSFSLSTGGGAQNSSSQAGTAGNTWGQWQQDATVTETEDTEASAKALKANGDLTINGGSFAIDASDDAIHSNGNVTINGGSLDIASGDDGVHADSTLTLGGGTLNITQSYEGLEAMIVNINDGEFNVTASDDGVNAAGGDGSSQTDRPGANPMDTQNVDDGSIAININGGTLNINASGDGLDSNASITQTGGTVVVDGPSGGGNSALDFDGSYNITGGILIASGSAEMLQTPSSGQNVISVTFTSAQAAGSAVSLTDGNSTLASITPTKAFQNVIISSPDLAQGSTYSLTYGGSSVSVTPSATLTSIDENGSAVQTPGGLGGGQMQGQPGEAAPGGAVPEGGQPPM
ncbi:MAG: carbohydrate-binding domain-containing protein [Eubacterium sp.]|nr:carbohydrate-binding domain-containing protein [Eubacterium sp.]